MERITLAGGAAAYIGYNAMLDGAAGCFVSVVAVGVFIYALREGT